VDRITLRGLEVFAHHGVFDFEQREGQTFRVDVTLWADLSQPGDSDDLADTIDYGRLASAIHERVAGERWNLLERVAQRVAEIVLDVPMVAEVEVTIHKPQAPIPHEFDDVAVTIRRAR
jgi:dihydroneopterin aldolase